MALATDKLLFLHIPKTGGMWIKDMLISLGLSPIDIGEQHDTFPYLSNFRDNTYYDNKLIFTAIRHPVSWYQSRWAFRMKHGWQAKHPLDWACASNDFNKFVNNVIRYKPTGWCTWLFNQYMNTHSGRVTSICRTEFLLIDFHRVLIEAGYDFTLDDLKKNDKLVNTSKMSGKDSKYWAKYDPVVLDKIIQVEDSIINRYYHDTHDDIIANIQTLV